MNKVFSLFLMALAFASCQNSNEDETSETVTSSPATLSAPASTPAGNTSGMTTTDPVTIPAPTAGPASASSPAMQTAPAPAVATAAKGSGKEALNPAHGAPGHRCDIAVGAPLSTPVSGNAAPAISTAPAPAISSSPAPAQPGNKNAKLNPAHGQPGHDCTIPVGQPLKS